MGYYIDLEKISMDEYRAKLETAYLPPSRILLKEKLNERFAYFKSLGISNVKELQQLLKNKDMIVELTKMADLSADYLSILLREINSTLPKPNKLADFNGIQSDAISKLEEIGITNTEKLFIRVKTKSDRQNLSDITGIVEADILKLTKLTDLSRIKWVGVTYAQMLYDLGIDSVQKVSKSDPDDLHSRINQLIQEKKVFRGAIGLNDVKILVASASEIPQEIEY